MKETIIEVQRHNFRGRKFRRLVDACCKCRLSQHLGYSLIGTR